MRDERACSTASGPAETEELASALRHRHLRSNGCALHSTEIPKDPDVTSVSARGSRALGDRSMLLCWTECALTPLTDSARACQSCCQEQTLTASGLRRSDVLLVMIRPYAAHAPRVAPGCVIRTFCHGSLCQPFASRPAARRYMITGLGRSARVCACGDDVEQALTACHPLTCVDSKVSVRIWKQITDLPTLPCPSETWAAFQRTWAAGVNERCCYCAQGQRICVSGLDVILAVTFVILPYFVERLTCFSSASI